MIMRFIMLSAMIHNPNALRELGRSERLRQSNKIADLFLTYM